MAGCPVCGGTGEFKVKQIDEEGNYIGDAVVKCECQKPVPKKRVKADGEVVVDADNNE